MARKTIRADEIKVGTVMAASLENEVFAVKQVYQEKNLAFGSMDVVVKGPLGITLKMHPSKLVGVLI